jgi:hypothetical protein
MLGPTALLVSWCIHGQRCGESRMSTGSLVRTVNSPSGPYA